MPDRPPKKNGKKQTFANRGEYFKALFNAALVATVNTDDLKKYLEMYNISTSEFRIELEGYLYDCGFPKGEIQTSADPENNTLTWFVPMELKSISQSEGKPENIIVMPGK